ncbi:hypothetical protein FXO37_08382 [Capsicum annuum]|nr:hypothetical protein FXO37_08382 [Capsicum annuum]
MSGITNVKKLGLCGNEEDYVCFQESRFFNNFFHLHQLETLSFQVNRYLNLDNVLTIPSSKVFPATIKKLKLINTGLSWEDLNIIGELPNLEMLKLKNGAFLGDEWHPIEGEFAR